MDVAKSLGGILKEELDLGGEIVAVDRIDVGDLDYVDIGRPVGTSEVLPVTVKSLMFPSELPAGTLQRYRATASPALGAERFSRGDALGAPRTSHGAGGLAEQPVVVGVGADPEPHEPVSSVYRQCAMMTADPRGPETPQGLEMRPWMTWVPLETLEGFIRELLDVLRQRSIACPEIRRSVVSQRGVVCPDAWSVVKMIGTGLAVALPTAELANLPPVGRHREH